MKKLLLTFLFLTNIILAQTSISIGYNKPDLDGVNGFYISTFGPVLFNEDFTTKVGFEVNFQFGSRKGNDPLLGLYEISFDIRKYELFSQLIYEKFIVQPFLLVAIGYEDFYRTVSLENVFGDTDINERSFYYKAGGGATVLLNENFSLTANYNYSQFFHSTESQSITNSRYTLAAGIIYTF